MSSLAHSNDKEIDTSRSQMKSLIFPLCRITILLLILALTFTFIFSLTIAMIKWLCCTIYSDLNCWILLFLLEEEYFFPDILCESSWLVLPLIHLLNR